MGQHTHTALWNTKIPHEQAESIVEHITRGNSFKETGELTHTHRTTVSPACLHRW